MFRRAEYFSPRHVSIRLIFWIPGIHLNIRKCLTYRRLVSYYGTLFRIMEQDGLIIQRLQAFATESRHCSAMQRLLIRNAGEEGEF